MALLEKHHRFIPDKDFLQTVDLLVRTIDRDKVPRPKGALFDVAKISRTSDINLRIRDPTTHINEVSKPRQHKVCTIRRQLQLGKYKVEARLTKVMDRLLENLLT